LFTKKKIFDKEGKYTVEKKELEIFLKPGWKGGTQVTFPNEGDVIPFAVPADIVVVIEEEVHPLFKREQNNLFFKKNISLLDALTGLALKIPHISGEELVVDIPGPISPGYQKVITGKGYISQRDGSRGDLFIVFNIMWPKVFTEEQKQALKEGPLGVCDYL